MKSKERTISEEIQKLTGMSLVSINSVAFGYVEMGKFKDRLSALVYVLSTASEAAEEIDSREIVESETDQNGIEYQLWNNGGSFSMVVWDMDSGQCVSRKSGTESVIREVFKQTVAAAKKAG